MNICFRLRSSAPGTLAALLLVGVAPSTVLCQPITCIYTPAGGFPPVPFWENPANWTPAVAPINGTPAGATYNAIVNAPASGVPIGVNVTIEQLNYLGGGPILGSPNGSTLTTNALSTLAAGQIGYGIGPARFIANGGANITGDLFVFSQSRLTLGGGTSNWSGGTVTLQTGSSWTNGASSTLLITGNNTLMSSTTIGTIFRNDGLIRKENSTGTTNLLGGQVMGTNNGAIEVLSGTLNVRSNYYPVLSPFVLSQSASGSIQIGPGATLVGPVLGGMLAGSGTITAGTDVDFRPNRLSPGIDGPGVLTSTGAIVLNSGSTFQADLDGPTVGIGYDQLMIGAGGSINLGGATLSLQLGYAPDRSDSLRLLAGGPVTGTFANASPGDEFFIGTFGGTGYAARITYDPTQVFLDNFRVFTVPEPGSWAFMAVAVAATWRQRRRLYLAYTSR